ncbi:hypothetical protein [Iningainema tapete]
MNEKKPLFVEITDEEVAQVRGGAATTVNFDLNTYLFVIGAGAIFNGGVTEDVIDTAFDLAVFTLTPGV